MKPKSEQRSVRAYHHGNLKNALVRSALAQIAAQGARSLSMREVARATGVSHASTYRHFPNKESVLATIAEQGFRALTDAMSRAARAHSDDAMAMLQATGIAYVEFGVTHAHHLQVMFGDLIADYRAYPTLVAASTAAYEVLASTVRAGQRSGHIDAERERVVALAAWSIVHGLALLIGSGKIRAADGSPTDHRALAAAVIPLLQTGLGPPPVPAPRARAAAQVPRARRGTHARKPRTRPVG